MRLKIDRENDALYFRLTDAAIFESEEVQPGVILAGVGVGGAVGLQAARNKAADTRVRRRRVIIGSFRSLQLRRLELKHTQLLRLSARAQRQHFDADDVASLIEVQNYTRLDFLRLEDRGVG